MDIVLISPVSPFDPTDGHRLAVLSDVCAILDNHLQLGVIAFTYAGEPKSGMAPLCPSKMIPTQGGGFVSRLLRGVVSGFPPSIERFYGENARREMRETLLLWKPQVVVIDDLSGAGYIPLIRELLPKTKVILRSHNVMHDVRLEQLRRTKGLTRPAIQLDCRKYLAFEKEAVEACDRHWAISQADADRMTQLYGCPTDCLTVSLPLEQYASLRPEEGRTNGFVHVGSLDFRRRSDLSGFLTGHWPKILKADSTAALTLAGALHGNPIPSPNVTYAGRVVSDVGVYRQGRFSLNFQSSTGGVKLKTLTSLAAGRVLVSTPEGVEGLPLESGKHFWDISTFVASPDLGEILHDFRAAQPLIDAGRSYVMTHHSRNAVARNINILLENAQCLSHLPSSLHLAGSLQLSD